MWCRWLCSSFLGLLCLFGVFCGSIKIMIGFSISACCFSHRHKKGEGIPLRELFPSPYKIYTRQNPSSINTLKPWDFSHSVSNLATCPTQQGPEILYDVFLYLAPFCAVLCSPWQTSLGRHGLSEQSKVPYHRKAQFHRKRRKTLMYHRLSQEG